MRATIMRISQAFVKGCRPRRPWRKLPVCETPTENVIRETTQTDSFRYSVRPDFGLAHPLLYDWRSALCLLKSTAVTTFAARYDVRGKTMSGIHFALLLLMFIPSLRQSPTAQSQTNNEKQRTATVSGRVILNGKPLSGVTVEFLPERRPGQAGRVEPLQAVADEQGSYHITGIPEGSYRVKIWPNEFLIVVGLPYPVRQKLINVAEGEKVEQFDLVLKRGGVITGRVSDASGRPLAGQEIKLTRIGDDGKLQLSSYNSRRVTMTDEQGVYRIFPLPGGRYLISAGMTPSMGIGTQAQQDVYYPHTYHPGVSDPSRARVVEVSEGAETAGVDILIAEAMKTYEIKGRVVNAETGNPVGG